MKRNKTLRIATILLALVLVSTLAMVGTLARYVDNFDGETRAVRAGLFRVTTGDITESVNFIRLDGCATVDSDVHVHAYDEPDAPNPEDATIIVPGSVIVVDGYITIQNFSEVTVDVTMVDLLLVGPLAADGMPLMVRVNAADPWLLVDDMTDAMWADLAEDALSLAPGGTPTVTEVGGAIRMPPGPSVAGAAPVEANVYVNLQILWPFGRGCEALCDDDCGYCDEGGVGVDGEESIHTNYDDTLIGWQQADDLLGPYTPAVPAVLGLCPNPYINDPDVCDCPGACEAPVITPAVPAIPARNTFEADDVPGTYYFNLELTLRAVQVD